MPGSRYRRPMLPTCEQSIEELDRRLGGAPFEELRNVRVFEKSDEPGYVVVIFPDGREKIFRQVESDRRVRTPIRELDVSLL